MKNEFPIPTPPLKTEQPVVVETEFVIFVDDSKPVVAMDEEVKQPVVIIEPSTVAEPETNRDQPIPTPPATTGEPAFELALSLGLFNVRTLANEPDAPKEALPEKFVVP
ncbi:hypothetical protein BDK51DRAFT_39965 [Blyttiomyces helicus]|uniref:Uncharacterized protein n=1 Tax=Blyttiomyces helicus TaxID=388810 RepID=A0A4P9WNJ1_9FUNG|nr:hypothetical protein BDK51DRAFT_39965 [Blyttiomyces helicus]|eukprot:RKO94534.1 hypothetical protein BDK51DRAFT_39965 [Blyttiomyces helicus]